MRPLKPSPQSQSAPDVFLSYARRDRNPAADLVKRFQNLGYTVWWDRRIPGGTKYEPYIAAQLEAARCVVVLYSRHALDSRWVRDEANRAAEREVLIPVLLEEVPLPLGTQGLQAIDLTAYPGKGDEAALAPLVDAVRQRVERSPVPASVPSGRQIRPGRPWRSRGLIVATGTLLPILVLIALATKRTDSVELSVELLATEMELRFPEGAALFRKYSLLSELGASRLDQILLPQASGEASSVITARKILLQTSAGEITLKPTILPRSTLIRLGLGQLPYEYDIIIEGIQELKVNVHGKMHVSILGESRIRIGEFDRDSLTFVSKEGTLHLNPTLLSSSLVLIEHEKAVDFVFAEISRVVEDEHTSTNVVWNVLSGIARFDSLDWPPVPFGEGRLLKMSRPDGTIESLKLRERDIEMTWSGSVAGLTVGNEEIKMPTLLEWVLASNPMPLIALSITYFVALAWGLLADRRAMT